MKECDTLVSNLSQLEAVTRERDRYKRELETLEAGSPGILVRYDRKCRCVYINSGSEALTGKPPSWFLGRLIDDFDGYPAEFKNAMKDGILGVFENGGVRNVHITLNKPWGTVHYVVRFTPERAADGSFDTVFGVGLDITEKINTEQYLDAVLQRQRGFIGMLSHELRNPLSTLSLGMTLLERLPASEDSREIFGMMSHQLEHIVRLVNDLMDISRIERGVLELQRDWVEVSLCITLAVNTVRDRLLQSPHSLHVIQPDPGVRVFGDMNRIAQVVSNLLHNAVKFSPEGSAINLNVTENRGTLTIEVSDQGMGIEAEQLEEVFNAFTQLKQDTSKHRDGVGIGLALVKGIAELYGGHASASSGGKGLGSTFTVVLPGEPSSI